MSPYNIKYPLILDMQVWASHPNLHLGVRKKHGELIFDLLDSRKKEPNVQTCTSDFQKLKLERKILFKSNF